MTEKIDSATTPGGAGYGAQLKQFEAFLKKFIAFPPFVSTGRPHNLHRIYLSSLRNGNVVMCCVGVNVSSLRSRIHGHIASVSSEISGKAFCMGKTSLRAEGAMRQLSESRRELSWEVK